MRKWKLLKILDWEELFKCASLACITFTDEIHSPIKKHLLLVFHPVIDRVRVGLWEKVFGIYFGFHEACEKKDLNKPVEKKMIWMMGLLKKSYLIGL